MFALEQIKTVHGKVKSGADFPAYIREIKQLGVTHYEAYVADGHTDYHGHDNYLVKVPEKYEPRPIADAQLPEAFKAGLLAHQQGKTDYLTFIGMCAETGIEKWKICLDKMTCTYVDKQENVMLVERIPE